MVATVDVLLAVYNGEAFLPALLDSLLAQTEQDFRLLISDDGSTDNSIDLLEAYRNRFGNRFELMSKDQISGSAVRNFARLVDAADAPYAAFCDQDDVWFPNKIETMLKQMRNAEVAYGSETPILVHSDLRIVDKNLATLHASFWKFQFLEPQSVQINRLLVQNVVTGCATLINRSLLLRARPIPAAAMMHDWWFALVAATTGHIEMMIEPTILYRQHDNNDTGAQRWGLKHLLRKALTFTTNGRQSISRYEIQAGALLKRFDNEFSPEKRCAVEALATMQQRSGIVRRWRLARYGLWKTGLLRNIGLLLSI